MFRNFKQNRLLAFLAVFVAMIMISSIVFAAVPTVSISRPVYSNYYLPGTSGTIEATINNSPTSRSFYWNNVFKGSLSLVSGSLYRGTWTPTTSDYIPGVYSGGNWTRPKNIKVTGTNGSGTGEGTRLGYVASMTNANYSSVDSTWNGSYIDEGSNKFYLVGTGYGPASHGQTGTYNCLAYSVGIYTSWQWPWSGYPTQTQVRNYMNGSDGSRSSGNYYYNTRTSYLAYTTKVIYYSGGHFSLVYTYDSSGAPKKVMSKWGALELILSDSYNAFSSGTYGSAQYFID